MARDIIEIEVVNFKTYNPRSDRKSHSWFRLQNDVATEPKFHGMSAAHRFVVICLFAEVSKSYVKRGDGTATIHVSWLADQIKVKPADVLKTIQHLADVGILRLPGGNQLVSTGTTTNERTNVTDVRNETDIAPGSAPTPAGLVWKKYKAAFEKRHGTAPPWNAKTAGQIKQFVARIPAEEAPEVAEFYLTHNDSYYVRNLHPVGMLLKDAEKLRTEWATGRQMTGGQARQVDRRQTNYNAFAGLLAEAEAKEREAGNG